MIKVLFGRKVEGSFYVHSFQNHFFLYKIVEDTVPTRGRQQLGETDSQAPSLFLDADGSRNQACTTRYLPNWPGSHRWSVLESQNVSWFVHQRCRYVTQNAHWTRGARSEVLVATGHDSFGPAITGISLPLAMRYL